MERRDFDEIEEAMIAMLVEYLIERRLDSNEDQQVNSTMQDIRSRIAGRYGLDRFGKQAG